MPMALLLVIPVPAPKISASESADVLWLVKLMMVSQKFVCPHHCDGHRAVHCFGEHFVPPF
jgi:hypothetical protein